MRRSVSSFRSFSSRETSRKTSNNAMTRFFIFGGWCRLKRKTTDWNYATKFALFYQENSREINRKHTRNWQRIPSSILNFPLLFFQWKHFLSLELQFAICNPFPVILYIYFMQVNHAVVIRQQRLNTTPRKVKQNAAIRNSFPFFCSSPS